MAALDAWRPTARAYLLLVFTLVSTVPLVAFGYVEAERKQRASLERFDHQADAQAAHVEVALSRLIQARLDVLKIKAATFSQMADWDDAEAVLEAQQGAIGVFDGVYVANRDAVSVAFAPAIRSDGTRSKAGISYQDRDYYQEMLQTGEVAYSKVQMGRQTKMPGFQIGVPIFERDEPKVLRGLVVGGVRLQLLAERAREFHGHTDGSRVVVVDGHGHSLIDTSSGLAPLDDLVASAVFAVPCPTGGASGVSGLDQLGIPVRASCVPMSLGRQRWSVWSVTTESALSDIIGDARRETLNLVLVTVLVALAAAFVLTRQLGRGIRGLTAAAQRVGAGDFSLRPKPPSWLSTRESAYVREVVAGTLDRLSAMDSQNRALVTQLQDANAQLEPLATAWREMGEAVQILDADGTVSFVNPAYDRLLGSLGEAVGRPSHLMSIDHDACEANLPPEGLVAHVAAGHSWSGELVTETPVGHRILATTVSPVLAEDGGLRLMVVLRHDVTEQRNAELASAHRERLAVVGTAVAGLAHEINNPLTCVQGNLQLLEEELQGRRPEPDAIAATVAEALDGVERATGLVRSLLRLARGGSVWSSGQNVDQVRLRDLVEAALTLCRPHLGPPLTVSVDVPDLTVPGVEAELVQVLMNLVLNAVYAMDGRSGSVLRITASGNVDTVTLQVRDNGPGMNKEVLDRIFEPFFTTKPPGEGTGLGLALCRNILEVYGGSLTARSTPGVGTSFSLQLPRAQQVSSEEAALQSAVQTENSQRVLLVDDDTAVARALARGLRGFDVTVCHSAEEAMALIEDGDQYGALVSDVMMPGLLGLDLLDELRLSHPQLAERLLFVTGGTPDVVTARRLERAGRPVLAKPVDLDALRRRVQGLVAAGRVVAQPGGAREPVA